MTDKRVWRLVKNLPSDSLAPVGRRSATSVLLAVVCLGFALLAEAKAAPNSPETSSAEFCVETSGVQGGLAVVVDGNDSRLLNGLGAHGRFLVQALHSDPNAVERLRSLTEPGMAAVDRWNGERLPLAEGIVNLLVVENGRRVAREEILRVLAPGGVALLMDEGGKITKPRPAAIDRACSSRRCCY